MKAEEILKGLDSWEEGIPEKLLLAAVANKDAVVPGLLAAVAEVSKTPEMFLDDPERNLYYWAVYLLAHFEEPKALRPTVDLIRLCGSDFNDMVEDISVDAPMLMANVSGGEIKPIAELLHDDGATELARESAVDALGLLCAWGAIEIPTIEEEYRRALAGIQRKESLVATAIVNASIDLNLRGLAPDITAAYDRGIVDTVLAEFEYTGEWLHDPDFEAPPPYLHLAQSIDDIVEFFQEKADEDEALGGIEDL